VLRAIKLTDGTCVFCSLQTPFAEFGLHSVSAISTNKNYVMIATIAASEKQWAKSEKNLRKIIDSYRVCVK